VLALSAGLLRSDEFLGDWGALLDGELDALEIALVRRDRYGKLISRSVFDGRPLLLEIVTPEGETLRAMNADGVEEMDDTLSTLGTDGILISVVWIGPHRPREEPKK
jgi:hypothetical protein